MTRLSVDPLLSEKELSGWLGISLPNLQRMRSKGTGPRYVQLSTRRLAYRKSDVEVWLESRTTSRVGKLASADRAAGSLAEVSA